MSIKRLKTLFNTLKMYSNKLRKTSHTIVTSYIPQKNRLILLSSVVGLCAGLSAAALKYMVESIHSLTQSTQNTPYSILHFLYPLFGILLTTILFKYILHSKAGKSLADIIYCIEQKSSKVPFEKTYTHILGGATTVGFGGSVGLEAPIVVTGAAIGSTFARVFKFNYKERTTLLASGASSGIAAIFNSPIAGLLFSIETLLPEFSIHSIVPLLVSTACAAIVSKLLYNDQLFVLISSGWNISSIPFYVIFAIGIGMYSAHFTKTVLAIKKIFDVRRHPFKKALSGGLLLCFIIFLFPPLYGEGYETIKILLSGDYSKLFHGYTFFSEWLQGHTTLGLVIVISILLIIVKPIATAITIAAGGVGGIFAPSLFIGAISGFIFSIIINQFTIINVPTVNFVVAGMAAALSGILHTPLTAIFLIAEITGGYSLFVPLMIVSAISFFVSKLFESETVYTYRLSQKGLLIGHDTDKFVLHHLELSSLINTKFTLLTPEMTLGEIVNKVTTSTHNIFPVVSPTHQLLGIIVLDDFRELMFQSNLYDTITAESLMKDPLTVLKPNENAEKALQKFDAYNAWHLPVIYYGRYIGMISKKTLYEAYRTYLVDSLKHSNIKAST